MSNVEHLKLKSFEKLSASLEGIVPKRGCLSMLKTLEESQLISFSFLRHLKIFEKIRVGDCGRVRYHIAGTAYMIAVAMFVWILWLPL